MAGGSSKGGALRGGFKALLVVLVAAAGWAFSFLNDNGHGETIQYAAGGWIREGIQWDARGNRFLVSISEGGIVQVVLKEGAAAVKEEVMVVLDGDYKGNSTLGIRVDPARNRVLAVVADMFGRKYGALAAYDLTTWKQLFLTRLQGPGDLLLADDVAVDPKGNAYVTDAAGNLIWKVSPDGSRASVLTSSPVFTLKRNRLPFNVVGLNGIDYHPDGYLIVIHSWSGALFKVSLDGSSVELIDAPLLVGGDGIALISPDKLVVAGIPGARLVESSDGWKTAQSTATYFGPFYRLPSAVAIKDGKAFINHMLSWGKTFVIKEATFKAHQSGESANASLS